VGPMSQNAMVAGVTSLAMSRIADAYARVSPLLAGRRGTAIPTRAHAWVLRRSGGRIGRRFLPHDGGFAVVASNAASERPPAWWLNLQAHSEAEAFIGGSPHPVRARAATGAEVEELWPRFVEMYRGYDHYVSIASRELPVVVLEPRS
jgi:F420H(2)-dependent quinone reductase